MRVIVDIKAGLGNQLFCYAFGYAVAKKNGADLCIETSVLDRKKIKDRYLEILKLSLPYKKRISFFYTYNHLLKKLKLNRLTKRLAIGLNTAIYKEKDKQIYDAGVYNIKGDIYFDGYWQNYRYFDEYRNELLDIAVPNDRSAVRELENDIKKSNSVSIHIRRGDYVSAGWEIPMSYYLDAIKLLREKADCDALTAYVFSDDQDFAREFFEKNNVDGLDIRYPDYNSEDKGFLDMYLMSCCRYNIIANSTFSWWAA